MIPDRSLEHLERNKNNKNGKYLGKNNRLFLSSWVLQSRKTKIMAMSDGVFQVCRGTCDEHSPKGKRQKDLMVTRFL